MKQFISTRCVSRNTGGEISSTLHLSIKRRFDVSVAPDIQTVDVGQKAAFSCKVHASNPGNGMADFYMDC